MNSKRSLIAILVAAAALTYGVIAGHYALFPASLLFENAGSDAQSPPSNPRPQEDVKPSAAVLSLPYVRGRHRASAERPSGVVTHGPSASDGYNLVVSAFGPQVDLIDMKGEVVHSWCRAFRDIKLHKWKGEVRWAGETAPLAHPGRSCFRRAYVQPDGSLLAIYEDIGVVKLDVNSKVAWGFWGEATHHSLDVAPSGTIYVLGKRKRNRAMDLRAFKTDGGQWITLDYVLALSPDGDLLDKFSLVDLLLESDYAPVMERVKHGDILHANSVHVIRHGPLTGQLMLSLRHLNAVAVLDPKERRITRVWSGLFTAQHEATVVAPDRILLFDNEWGEGASRVIEMDTEQKIVWRHPSEGESTFFSALCGTCQRLRNGNTLITVSESGRALEVNPNGTIVWDFYSDRRFEEDKVATLYDLRRVYRDQIRFKFRGKQ